MKKPWYAELNAQINENYAIAQEYYRQKEQQFQKVVLRDSISNITSFERHLTELAQSFNPNVYQQVVSALEGGSSEVRTGTPMYDISANRILSAVLQTRGQQPYYKAGIEFEHFMADNIKLDSEDMGAISDYAMQQVGSVVNKSFVTGGVAKDTRTDIAITAAGKKITKDDQLELTVELNIEDLKSQFPPNLIMSSIEKAIAESKINTDVFGFQVKTYSDIQSGRWMNSDTMVSKIQSEFDNGKMWSSNYAPLYAQWILSKYVINLINPTNVGLVYGGGFMYTSQLLEKMRFYVKVGAKYESNKKASAKRGGGYNIYPTVVGNEITMYVMNKGNMIKYISYKKDGNLVIKVATVK